MMTLAIETSCDDTSVALLRNRDVVVNLVSSQIVNKKFTGIVPELAARAHQANLVPVIQSALDQSGISIEEIDLVTTTQGPGLVGSLLVGLNFAKAFAYGLGRPWVGVNHIEAHMMASFFDRPDWGWPFVALIVSGGHTLVVESRSLQDHRILGRTLDDAAGECFDKVARVLEVLSEGSVMGGPVIDQLAIGGDATRFEFPRPMSKDQGFNFSFSGLKTAVQNFVLKRNLTENDKADVCASFQEAVVDVLCQKAIRACLVRNIHGLVVCGGVASNRRLRQRILEEASAHKIEVAIPAAHYCTDNAAMIGLTGLMHFEASGPSEFDLTPFASIDSAQLTQK